VLGRVVGEIQPSDIPFSQGVSDETVKTIQGDDHDPMQVVIEIAPGKGGRGWIYGEDVLKKLVDHVQQHTLNGFLGHQKEEDLPTEFRSPATHWVGSKWQSGKAYFRGVIDPNAADLKRWIRAGRITQPSVFTTPTVSKRGGETHVTDLQPLSIDWAPLHRAGMPTASVVGWGEMRPLGDDDVLPAPGAAVPTTQARQNADHVVTLQEVAALFNTPRARPEPVPAGEMSPIWKASGPQPATAADLSGYFEIQGADRR
jgi:hypothetical protein